MAVKCTFDYDVYADGRVFYICKIMQQYIPNCGLKIFGRHLNEKKNVNVQEVRFIDCSIHHIPKGLTKYFPAIEDLSIRGSKICKISKEDLAEYKNLKRIYISNSYIDFLPGDLFNDFRYLEEISFDNGNLKLVEPNILDGLNELKLVDFEGVNYMKKYSVYPEHEPNATLEEVKNELNQVFKCYNDIIQNQIGTANIATVTSVETQTDSTNKPKYEPENDISYHLKNHIKDDRFKDFKICIEDREFHVHKFVLAARSPTLAEILLSNPEVENLNLVDIPVDIFEMILNYFYTDELPNIEGLDSLRLFAVAGRLKIEELKDFAAINIFDKINGQNALEILKLSNKFEHAGLKQKAYEKIKVEYPKIQFKNSWTNKPNHVEKVIRKFEDKERAMKMLEDNFQNDLMESD